MSVARISNLPEVENLSALSEEERQRSLFEISLFRKDELQDGTETNKWDSKCISYSDMAKQIATDSKTIISSATSSDFGMIKLGAERIPQEYKFPVELDTKGRAYVRTQEDAKLTSTHTEQWDFILTGGTTTSRNVLVSTTPF